MTCRAQAQQSGNTKPRRAAVSGGPLQSHLDFAVVRRKVDWRGEKWLGTAIQRWPALITGNAAEADRARSMMRSVNSKVRLGTPPKKPDLLLPFGRSERDRRG